MILSLFSRRLHLYRRSSFQASGAVLLVCAAALSLAVAQHRGSHRLRATAVLELTTDANGRNSAHLTAVTILDDGHYFDASVYKSRPRPLALDNGVVYEAQKTGLPVGYVTITNGEEKGGFWIAGGSWKAAPAETKVASKPDASATPKPGSADDRPVLRRPATPNADTGAGSGELTPAPASAPDPAAAPAAPDPDRPTLRHTGTTAQQQQEQENQAQPSARIQVAVAAASPKPQPPGTQTLVAVSDVQTNEARSFEFTWRPEDKTQIESKIRRLALDQLPKQSPPLKESSLKDVVIRSFDVDLTNDAIVVLTAEVPPSSPAPPPPSSRKKSKPAPAPAAEGPPVSRFIALIARVDLEGNPQKLLASVTDSSHQDVVPRLELIDAVDVDGDGRAELLFRQYGFKEKSYVIYSVGHGLLTKVFEGASQSLR